MMDKLISQQAAIDAIKKRLFETAFNNVGIKQNIDETLVDVAENRLEIWFNELPPVQPEPRTAYWTKDIVGSVICSNCGGIREDNRIGHTQWCNCCGCFMRGE